MELQGETGADAQDRTVQWGMTMSSPDGIQRVRAWWHLGPMEIPIESGEVLPVEIPLPANETVSLDLLIYADVPSAIEGDTALVAGLYDALTGDIFAQCSGQTTLVGISIQGPDFIPTDEAVPYNGTSLPPTNGTYKWTAEPGDKIEIEGPDDQPTVTVRGKAPSDTLGDVTLELKFTPITPGARTATTTHKLTVIKVDLEFRNNGTVSDDNTKHDAISSTVGTDLLGLLPVPTKGVAGNAMEIIGRIINISPTTTSVWNFRRHINSKKIMFTPEDAEDPEKEPYIIDPESPLNKSFSDPSPNDDPDDTDETLEPNNDNEIFVYDRPAIDLDGATLVAAPTGTVVAVRFHAKEWLELCVNGDRVSRVLKWICSITIRKKADGTWERVGLNEIRELGPDEEFPPKVLTREEAIAAQNE